jgi:branched-chain amino acid transport system ATP-binding protein
MAGRGSVKMSMLKIENLQAAYGSIIALRGVSLEVGENEIVAVIGANGAGKSTLLRSLSGLLPKRGGTVTFMGKDITKASSDQIVRMGLIQVPEGRQIFNEMSVLENLRMGAFARSKKEDLQQDIDHVFSLFPRLRERSSQKGGSLSGGEQQMLSLSRALMSRPKLLMLDEPSMGLAPIIVESIFDIITQINREGIPIILIEQDALMALEIADRAYVLETGRIALEGRTEDLINNDRMREVYLGG